MTTIPFGSTGTLAKRDDWGGFSDVGGTEPGVWATDDGDTSYLRWTTPNLFAPPPSGTDSYLDWTPAPFTARSVTLRLRAKHAAGGPIPAGLSSIIWRNDMGDLRTLAGLPNFTGSGYETIASDPLTDATALSWLATGGGFIRLTFATFAGAVGLATGDETRYTLIELDTTLTPPSVRQRQIPGNVRQRQMPGTVRQRQNAR